MHAQSHTCIGQRPAQLVRPYCHIACTDNNIQSLNVFISLVLRSTSALDGGKATCTPILSPRSYQAPASKSCGQNNPLLRRKALTVG